MSDQLLVNIIRVPAAGNLAPGAIVTLPHGLKYGGNGVVPNQYLPWSATNIIVNFATDTDVTFQNTGDTAQFAFFRIEYDHSIHAVDTGPLYYRGITGTSAPSGPAGGDLAGTYPNPKVVGIDQRPIDQTDVPAVNDVIQWDGAKWTYQPAAGAPTNAVYGSYSNTDGPTVIPVAPLNPLAVTFDTVEAQNGVSLVGGSKLTVSQSGVYEVSFSPQLVHAGGNASVISMWLRLNGLSPVPRTNSDIRLANNNDTIFLYIAVIISLNAGDYVEWLMSSDNAGPTTFVSFAGSGGVGPNDRPLAPALITSIKRLGA